MYDNSFEKFPSNNHETKAEWEIPPEQDFAKSFESGVPQFTEENNTISSSEKQFGMANEKNTFYGEATDEVEAMNDYNDGVANAASLINYGLDAIAREKGVEAVVQGIKNFDATGSDNPLKDLYDSLGINTSVEFEDIKEESMATKNLKNQFKETYNMPKTNQKSNENLIKAIADMKELIAEVEGADPRYEELRNGARTNGKGYFEYAVKDFGLRGLTDLFSVLSEQKEKAEEPEKPGEVKEAVEDDEQAKKPEGL